MLAESGLNLDWGYNGYLPHISRPTTLDLPEGVPGRAFNVSPAGLNKGRGIARFCELRGIDPAETLSIGDASSDFLMADATDTFFLVENGLNAAGVDEFLATHEHAYVTQGRNVDGWVSSMRTLLAAKR